MKTNGYAMKINKKVNEIQEKRDSNSVVCDTVAIAHSERQYYMHFLGWAGGQATFWMGGWVDQHPEVCELQ